MAKNAPRFNSIHWGLLTVFFLLPGYCQAAVFITEVAWMGNDVSANHEWIELYNDGSATTLDGWTLSDGRNLSIELAGTLPAQSYAVLERTSDDSAPSAAWLIYTGALTNSGGTLTMHDASGQLVDQVAGGTDWSAIGGDNTTKETAQYTAKGWHTAGATPGQANHAYTENSEPAADEKQEKDEEEATDSDSTKDAEESGDESKDRSKNSSSGTASTQSVRLTLPDVTLQLEIDAQSVGYVNQDIAFASEASGIGKNLLSSLSYQWNFGDGNVSRAQSPQHTFAYPGTYVVTLHAEYKRQRQTTRHEITILPVKLSLTQNQHGDIQLNNDSPYEIDISGYQVKGSDSFEFPEYSVILPKQTITIPRQRVAKAHPVLTTVHDAQRVHLATLAPPSWSAGQNSNQPTSATLAVARAPQQPTAGLVSRPTSAQTPAAPKVLAAATTKPAPSATQTIVNESETKTSAGKSTSTATQAVATQTQLAAASAAVALDTLTRRQRLSYVGLVTIILLAIFFIYFTSRRPDNLS